MEEGLPTVVREVPRNSLTGETGKRDHNVRIALNEPAVEIGEAKEGLNILDFPWLKPIEDGFDFVAHHREPRQGKDISKVFDGLQVPFTFLWLEVKAVGMETSEDVSDMLAMEGKVRGVD